MTWWTEAACQGVDDTVFFPTVIGTGCYQQAKAICAACPVRDACLHDAIRARVGSGFVGGMAPNERAEIAVGPGRGKRPHVKPCGTEAAYRRHLRRGEAACPECRAAHALTRAGAAA